MLGNVFIGIDPGLSGAVAVITETFSSQNIDYKIFDTPVTKIIGKSRAKNEYRPEEMAFLLREIVPQKYEPLVFIEKVHSMPGQGVASMFSMGYGYGLWRGIVTTLGYPMVLLTPQEWKKAMLFGSTKEKAQSAIKAAQLCPGLSFFGPKGRPLDGRGDAMLIAMYGRRNNTILT